jgi:hypothetical protein
VRGCGSGGTWLVVQMEKMELGPSHCGLAWNFESGGLGFSLFACGMMVRLGGHLWEVLIDAYGLLWKRVQGPGCVGVAPTHEMSSRRLQRSRFPVSGPSQSSGSPVNEIGISLHVIA